ncbi:MAG: hypothetical protein LBI19_07570 [Oscillospiraceae bacterium]|nr:hypothetical protein [Oscillospiraceae bacterium]
MPTQEIAFKNNYFEMILRAALELPGVKINRESFLRKELSKYFDDDVVEKAIETNPAQAGLSIRNLEQRAKACIHYETAKVTTISAAAGIPGGFAMAATLPADIVQFFGHAVRILQKLIYLYGWQALFRGDDDGLDDETSNELTLFIGVMFGVGAANAAITKIANAAAIQTEKTLLRAALTKGTIYPIVNKIAKVLGFKMTKGIFAKGVGKAIPVVGAVISGGVTYIGFRPMAKRLQNYLIDLPLASVDFYKESSINNIGDEIISVDFSDIVVEDVDGDDEADEVNSIQ